MIHTRAESQAEIARAHEETGYNYDILGYGKEFQVKTREMYIETPVKACYFRNFCRPTPILQYQ